MGLRFSQIGLGRVVVALWALAAVLVVAIVYRLLFTPPADAGQEIFPPLPTSAVVEGPDGHAYQYVAAPGLTWEQARAAAARLTFQGHPGYLATIDDQAEFDFVMTKVFTADTDVTYLGGRQTAPGEWRWVTGDDAMAENGKGVLFWKGNENGEAQNGHYADWMNTAFQHGSRWDVTKVCCVTLFSYRKRQFSTSLGNADPEEGVAGYLVEFGN